MRVSVLAVILLVCAGVLGYALTNDKLPGPVEASFHHAAQWVGGLWNGNAGAASPELAARPAAASGAARPASGGRRGGTASVPVEVATASSTPSESVIRSVGSLASDESVSISVEQAGRIVALKFREGDRVQTGDVLVKLDDALLQAELADAKSRLVLAEGNFKRANSLSQVGAGTGRALDEARSAMETARAAVDLAQTRLSKTEIVAPFAGVVGLRGVSVGAFVEPGQAIVNLEKIDTLKLDFKVPEGLLSTIRPGLQLEVTVDAYPDRAFTGEIYAINPMVDINGRALSVRARLENKDDLLRPGLFARVSIRKAPGQDVVIVPEGAIVPRPDGVVVFRVQDGKAIETPVRLGERRAGAVEVISGVRANEVVIVAGHTRLKDGATVEVVQSADTRKAG